MESSETMVSDRMGLSLNKTKGEEPSGESVSRGSEPSRGAAVKATREVPDRVVNNRVNRRNRGPAPDDKSTTGGPAPDDKTATGGPAPDEDTATVGPAPDDYTTTGGPAPADKTTGGPAPADKTTTGCPSPDVNTTTGGPAPDVNMTTGGPAPDDKMATGGPAPDDDTATVCPTPDEDTTTGSPAPDNESANDEAGTASTEAVGNKDVAREPGGEVGEHIPGGKEVSRTDSREPGAGLGASGKCEVGQSSAQSVVETKRRDRALDTNAAVGSKSKAPAMADAAGEPAATLETKLESLGAPNKSKVVNRLTEEDAIRPTNLTGGEIKTSGEEPSIGELATESDCRPAVDESSRPTLELRTAEYIGVGLLGNSMKHNLDSGDIDTIQAGIVDESLDPIAMDRPGDKPSVPGPNVLNANQTLQPANENETTEPVKVNKSVGLGISDRQSISGPTNTSEAIADSPITLTAVSVDDTLKPTGVLATSEPMTVGTIGLPVGRAEPTRAGPQREQAGGADESGEVSARVETNVGHDRVDRIKESNVGNDGTDGISESNVGNDRTDGISESNVGNDGTVGIKGSNAGNDGTVGIKGSNKGNDSADGISKSNGTTEPAVELDAVKTESDFKELVCSATDIDKELECATDMDKELECSATDIDKELECSATDIDKELECSATDIDIELDVVEMSTSERERDRGVAKRLHLDPAAMMDREDAEAYLNTVCRLCLASGTGVTLLNVFTDGFPGAEGGGIGQTTLSEVIGSLLTQEVAAGGYMPQNVCSGCVEMLQMFHDFRRSSLQTYDTLVQFVRTRLPQDHVSQQLGLRFDTVGSPTKDGCRDILTEVATLPTAIKSEPGWGNNVQAILVLPTEAISSPRAARPRFPFARPQHKGALYVWPDKRYCTVPALELRDRLVGDCHKRTTPTKKCSTRGSKNAARKSASTVHCRNASGALAIPNVIQTSSGDEFVHPDSGKTGKETAINTRSHGTPCGEVGSVSGSDSDAGTALKDEKHSSVNVTRANSKKRDHSYVSRRKSIIASQRQAAIHKKRTRSGASESDTVVAAVKPTLRNRHSEGKKAVRPASTSESSVCEDGLRATTASDTSTLSTSSEGTVAAYRLRVGHKIVSRVLSTSSEEASVGAGSVEERRRLTEPPKVAPGNNTDPVEARKPTDEAPKKGKRRAEWMDQELGQKLKRSKNKLLESQTKIDLKKEQAAKRTQELQRIEKRKREVEEERWKLKQVQREMAARKAALQLTWLEKESGEVVVVSDSMEEDDGGGIQDGRRKARTKRKDKTRSSEASSLETTNKVVDIADSPGEENQREAVVSGIETSVPVQSSKKVVNRRNTAKTKKPGKAKPDRAVTGTEVTGQDSAVTSNGPQGPKAAVRRDNSADWIYLDNMDRVIEAVARNEEKAPPAPARETEQTTNSAAVVVPLQEVFFKEEPSHEDFLPETQEGMACDCGSGKQFADCHGGDVGEADKNRGPLRRRSAKQGYLCTECGLRIMDLQEFNAHALQHTRHAPFNLPSNQIYTQSPIYFDQNQSYYSNPNLGLRYVDSPSGADHSAAVQYQPQQPVQQQPAQAAQLYSQQQPAQQMAPQSAVCLQCSLRFPDQESYNSHMFLHSQSGRQETLNYVVQYTAQSQYVAQPHATQYVPMQQQQPLATQQHTIQQHAMQQQHHPMQHHTMQQQHHTIQQPQHTIQQPQHTIQQPQHTIQQTHHATQQQQLATQQHATHSPQLATMQQHHTTHQPQPATHPPQHATQPQHQTTHQPQHTTHQPQLAMQQQQHVTHPPQHAMQQQQHPTRQPQHNVTQQQHHLTQQPQHNATQQPQHNATQQPQHNATQQQQPQHNATQQQPQHNATQQPQHNATRPSHRYVPSQQYAARQPYATEQHQCSVCLMQFTTRDEYLLHMTTHDSIDLFDSTAAMF